MWFELFIRRRHGRKGIAKVAEDKRTLIKIAHYYYKQGLTQQEIAEKLLMSRQKVNRLVKRLIEESIVTIHINGYLNNCIDIENELEKKFKLKQAIVVPHMEGEDLFDSLGAAGAVYLNDIIDDNNIIGVAWGRTMLKLATHLTKTSKKNISVVQLVGATNSENAAIQSDEITRIIANKLGGTPQFMYAPTFVRNEETKKALMSEESIKSSFNMMNKCHIIINSVGELKQDPPLSGMLYPSQTELDNLIELGTVGNTCRRYYDINGKIINTSINSTVMGIEIEDLKKIPTVVAIAGGDEKVLAILGALRGGFLNVLITDDETASSLLKKVQYV